VPSARTWLTATLLLATANTSYLTWRYLAVRHGLAEPGTGLCSWSAAVDCDPVLLSPEARWFFVPNAVLGGGFFSACTIGWLLARRQRGHAECALVEVLSWSLLAGALASLWFLYLMTRLDWLCPLCPWNHVLAFASAGLAFAVRRTRRGRGGVDGPARSRSTIARVVLACTLCGASWPLLWWLGSGR
jgi:uncharacterized membrane protein